MAFNKKAFWTYLYEHDNGEFISLNELLKKTCTPADYEEIKAHFQHLGGFANHYMEFDYNMEDFDNPNHITRLGKNGITLDDLSINGRITDDGRWYFSKAYLAQYFMDDQKELGKSILTTNKFVIASFGALIATIFLQAYSIYITHQDAQGGSTQAKETTQQELKQTPPVVNIYFGDSLRTTSNGNKTK